MNALAQKIKPGKHILHVHAYANSLFHVPLEIIGIQRHVNVHHIQLVRTVQSVRSMEEVYFLEVNWVQTTSMMNLQTIKTIKTMETMETTMETIMEKLTSSAVVVENDFDRHLNYSLNIEKRYKIN